MFVEEIARFGHFGWIISTILSTGTSVVFLEVKIGRNASQPTSRNDKARVTRSWNDVVIWLTWNYVKHFLPDPPRIRRPCDCFAGEVSRRNVNFIQCGLPWSDRKCWESIFVLTKGNKRRRLLQVDTTGSEPGNMRRQPSRNIIVIRQQSVTDHLGSENEKKRRRVKPLSWERYRVAGKEMIWIVRQREKTKEGSRFMLCRLPNLNSLKEKERNGVAGYVLCVILFLVK